MQPPIISGSILRDRYIIKHVIGQGGMGRTYMAADTERFNELCVLKEFIPFANSPVAMEKARELFQREASILYQIRHPQVPQFRASFATGDRLFLVQDYVEGQTFRDLLLERLRQHNTFTEPEVINLLFQVLPILSHLHSRHIIHRDISPENLILRTPDQLPVLIDFGVVKETATKIFSQSATVVGKLGYAPPEQMQSGRAYPSSDLYALAASVVVLLTGREPQDLFDDNTMTWHWRQYATVGDRLGQILEQMLSFKPSDRYSNAQEVLAALASAQAINSSVQTVAVGKKNPITKPVKPKPSKNFNNLLQTFFTAIALVVISGGASWAIASWFLQNQNISQDNRQKEPPITVPPANIPPPKVNTNINKGLELQNNQATINDTITAGQTITYRLEGKKDQTLTAALNGSGLVMSLIYIDQKPIDNFSSNLTIGYWRGKLPATGAYFIIIKPAQGITETSFELEVKLEEPPQPAPKPPLAEPIELPPETLSRSITATATPLQPLQYDVTVSEGQTLEVAIAGEVLVEILNPEGVMVWDSSNPNPPKITNTLAGTYQIIVKSLQESPFQLEISATN